MKNKKVRILVVEGSQNPPSFIRGLIQGLVDNNIDVGLLGAEKGGEFMPVRSGSFKRIVTRYQRFNFLYFVLAFAKALIFSPARLRRAWLLTTISPNRKVNFKRSLVILQILEFDPHIIHVQWASHLAEFATLLRKSKYKFLLSLRGRQINVTPAIDEKTADLYRELFPHVSAFHAVSNAIGIEAMKYGARDGKIYTIYSPVPEKFFNSFIPEADIKNKPLKIISIGRFHWMKGYTHALDAMKTLYDRKINFHYTIIASGDIPDEILYQINDLGIAGCVQIVNGVTQDEIVKQLLSHSVFLLSSVKEGIANVAIEAMAAGLPVISTDCGGMHEVIKNGENGFLIKTYDSSSLAEALLGFAEMNEDAIITLRIKAHEKARQKFYYPEQIRKFIDLYQSI